MVATTGFTDRVIGAERDHVLQIYGRPPFVLTHGKGMMVYDADGNEYLDFVAGIAVNALGYADEELTRTIQAAAANLIHVSNLYHTAPQAELAQMLCDLSFADKVYFGNSGAEAVEASIKFSRKYQYAHNQTDKTEIVCFHGAFHGRTFGALSLTTREKYQKPFQPLLPGVKVANREDLDSVKAVMSERTAAVIIEPVQGEGGINPSTSEFLQGLRELCDEHGALLIFDQIQCGMGRTGDLWSHLHSGIEPDMMTLAKPLAGGLPISAVLMTEAVASTIKPGEHGSTFAGGPLVTSAAKVVLSRISQPAFLQNVAEVGDYLMERLEEINSPLVKEVRGRGLMVGMELTEPAAPLVKMGYEHGLLLVTAGENVLRFVPPLIAQKEHVDVLADKLSTMLSDYGSALQ